MFDELNNLESSLLGQLILLFLCSLLWFYFIPWLDFSIFQPILDKHPAKEQFAELYQKMLKNSFGIRLSRAEAYKFGCLFTAVFCQHLIGAILCIPAAFSISWIPVHTACFLSRLGAISEAGWELQDTMVRMYELRYGGEEGQKKNPFRMCVVVGIHHMLGLTMIIPMNLTYGNSKLYHEMIFILQGASAIAGLAASWGYTLDVKITSELLKMNVAVLFTWLAILYCRIVRYGTIGFQLLLLFYHDQQFAMLVIGTTTLLGMAILNMLYFIDATGKLAKFPPWGAWISEKNHKQIIQGNKHLTKSSGAPFGKVHWKGSKIQ